MRKEADMKAKRHSRKDGRMTIASISNRWHRWALTGLAAALAAVLLALASPAAAAAAKTLNVNPVTGSDANPGTATKPLKTLTKALKLARSGDTVELAGGGYGPGASGDQFPQSGLIVPAGVTIEGATDNGFPTATLLGSGSGAALNLPGSATIRNLFWGGQGFGVGLYAKQGTQTLSNLFMGTPPGATATLDGLTLNGGIVVRGTANATLSAGASGANTTGSTLFINGGTGMFAFEQAQLTMTGGEIDANRSAGVRARGQARFTMDGGRIVETAGASCPESTGIELEDAAAATLTNSVQFRNLSEALTAHDAAKASLVGARITKDYGPGCAGFPSVRAQDSAALSLDGAAVQATGGDSHDVGISTSGHSTLALKNTVVSGHKGSGLEVGQETIPNANTTTPDVTIDGGSFVANGTGISQPSSSGTPLIKVTGALVSQNDIGIRVRAPMLKLRSSKVVGNQTGIEIDGTVGGIPVRDTLCALPCVNLGFGADPGNNNLAANVVGVLFRPNDINAQSSVPALGNIWNATTQGTDSNGLYTTDQVVRAGDPLSTGHNFYLPPGTNTVIEVGPTAAVGTFSLGPRTLTAHAGRPATWRLAWTHPVGWKRLDKVMLQLESRGKPVGRITIDQQTRRLRASGPAVRLVARRSTVAGRGKRLTARVTLRVAKRYAGRTLVARLAASDDNGTRQGWGTAGRLRVLAR
jgi:hypothetical protein